MTFADGLTNLDAFVLDRGFQKLADRLDDKPSAFDIGISLELGAVVFEIAADAALFAIVGISFGNLLWNIFNIAGGVMLYVFMNRQRTLVRHGAMNPLRVMLRPIRLMGLGFVVWSLFSAATAQAGSQLFYGFSALSNIAFVAGMYLISCQPRPPGWRLAQRRRRSTGYEAPSFT